MGAAEQRPEVNPIGVADGVDVAVDRPGTPAAGRDTGHPAGPAAVGVLAAKIEEELQVAEH